MSFKICGINRVVGVLGVVVPMAFVWLISKIWREAE